MDTEHTPTADRQMSSTGSTEFTIAAIALGIAVAVVMTAANVYLGLYAGMTVSASIPAAVIAMGVFRVLRQNNILASNIVQTMASAGESLAAGVIFTVPALVLVGAWADFKFWPTTLIAICGGVLGVVFMIPLRRVLVVEDEELTYPEGVACAAVLTEGSAGGKGLRDILAGLGLGGLFKFAGTGLGLISGSVEWATKFGNRAFFFGSDISPALLAVGYIVRLEIAVLVFIGGAIGWLVGIPLLGSPGDLSTANPLDTAWELWTSQVRYLGVGAMIVGGVWSIVAVRSGIVTGLHGLRPGYSQNTANVAPTERNMSLGTIGIILALTTLTMFGLYEYLLDSVGISLIATAVMLVTSFFITAVASYICGLVGSSNSPVSGMTICALLGTAAFLLVLGFRGDSAILATLGVAAVVCCAACTSGDCSQDLKTGYLIGASPRLQQYAQIIGVLVPAFTIAPVLTLLHSSYGIGTGLKAPQATLFASIANGLFGKGELPYDMVLAGIVLGIVIIIGDTFLKRSSVSFRLHVMPLAVGIYLPITLAVPILLGGIIRTLVDCRNSAVTDTADENEAAASTDRGVLVSSGLIAGEAILGVLMAVVIYLNYDWSIGVASHTAELLGIMSLVGLAWYVWWVGQRSTRSEL
jgi:putative OPT family oligopeptide transporter